MSPISESPGTPAPAQQILRRRFEAQLMPGACAH